MKTKDIVALVAAAGIFLVAGYIAYTQFVPKSAANDNGTKVEVVGPISPDIDNVALSNLKDQTKNRDYSVPVDLTTGLDNTAIFGQ